MLQAGRYLARVATLASLLLGSSALAQEVQIFEEAPPLELLRSIMVPESRPGLSRRFVPGEPAHSVPLAREPAAARPEPATDTQPAAACNAVSVSTTASVSVPDPAGSVGFRINFALNSDAVPPSAFPFLDRIGELLHEQPQLKLEVQGHTDAVGSDVYNLLLSQRRAAAVAHYLMQRHGVDMARLVVLGMGKSTPLFENGYDPRNRRVQFARAE